MAELMIAVVILGIGLLITSSMFPIAWYKAREVAEAAVVPALANAGEVHLKLTCRTSPVLPTWPDCFQSAAPPPILSTSFFPGDWIPVVCVADISNPDVALVYSDTRVHHMNAGNYLADGSDKVDLGGNDYWVADDTWRLEDNLDVLLADRSPLQVGFDPAPQKFWELMKPALAPQIAAHARLSPPLDGRPDPDANPSPAQLVKTHWEERFELRRHCWSVFYRFNELPGLEYSIYEELKTTNSPIDPDQARAFANRQLMQPRTITAYYVTLKRPVGARYAQQKGYDPRDSSVSLAGPIDPSTPEPLSADYDVRLPVPWRFGAELVTLPSDPTAVTDDGETRMELGAPAEIFVPRHPQSKFNSVFDALDKEFVLLDDRTGQVFRITNRREVDSPRPGAVLTLDGFYSVAGGEYAPDYDSTKTGTREAWELEWRWQLNDCTAAVQNVFGKSETENGARLPNDLPPLCQPINTSLAGTAEDDPKTRYYWVFLPPVDGQRGPDNSLLFNGSQPVVGVEVRQLTL